MKFHTLAERPVLPEPAMRRMPHPAGGYVGSYTFLPEHNEAVVLFYPAFFHLSSVPTRNEMAQAVVVMSMYDLTKASLPDNARWVYGKELVSALLDTKAVDAARLDAKDDENASLRARLGQIAKLALL